MSEETRYYYDPETCTFVEVERGPRYWLKWGSALLVTVLVLAVGAVWVLDTQMVTPQEKVLKAENQALEQLLSRANNRMGTLSDKLDQLAKKDRKLYRTLLQTDPISEDIREVGVGGADPHRSFDQFDEKTATLLRETAETLGKIERRVSLQSASYRELISVAEGREKRLEQLPAIMPANGPVVSGYGKRFHPVLEVRKMHAGIDLLLRRGTPVMATGDGIVRRAGHSPAYGHYVDIRHPAAGYMTRYAHLSEFAEGLERGQRVERGDTIAYSGNSGRSTGPHLHYEVRTTDGRTENPVYFFAPEMTPSQYFQLAEQTERLEAPTAG
jgi:murein DD-endopeptidase MepM/ murein hydrolase activator NlpD